MLDYEYLFATTLHARLKEKIIGKIFCKVYPNDELVIEVTNYENFIWKYTIGNFSERIMHGCTTEYIAYDVVTAYKKTIMKRYFI